jgi:hypothetical protein
LKDLEVPVAASDLDQEEVVVDNGRGRHDPGVDEIYSDVVGCEEHDLESNRSRHHKAVG